MLKVDRLYNENFCYPLPPYCQYIVDKKRKKLITEIIIKKQFKNNNVSESINIQANFNLFMKLNKNKQFPQNILKI